MEKQYMNPNLSPEERAKLLLSELTVEDKINQLCSQMLFNIDETYESTRKHEYGHFRNPGHFMHYKREKPAKPSEVAERINRDVKLSIEKCGIPPIENGEALHGAQWGMATCFPQPIGMASTFDKKLVALMGDVIGKECAAVGVHQVFAPVVNLARDCRWGRTVETFGEDPLLASDMGTAICKGLENNGVIASPKHYADNYAAGGRDSNYSENSERTLREIYLKPFEKCFKEGGAHSVMAAYNAWDGVPCSCNKRLLTDILRNEWGFDGFVISDYGGVEGVRGSHLMTDEDYKAWAMCLEAGLDVNLPNSSAKTLRRAYDEGYLSDAVLDTAVFRVLKTKFELGLFDNPYVSAEEADKTVRCDEHKKIALEGARESVVLLKNNGVLPLKKEKIRKLGVFGASADILPVGLNYSGPYGVTWKTDDAKTPLQCMREKYPDIDIVYASDSEIEKIAPECDACLYFTTVVEGEGMDRCNIRLPKMSHKASQDDAERIVGNIEYSVKEDQHDAIRRMTEACDSSIVILLNGAPIEMTDWIDKPSAVIEAWYPGEQGAQAISEILFGECNPSGKLPISFPKSVGQLPLCYDYKPSGRGYGYNDNDGTPLFAFGFGLSYTSFEIGDVAPKSLGNSLKISFSLSNTGDRDGTEVVQVYLKGKHCDVVMPLKSLKGYSRVTANKGETVRDEITLGEEAFSYYNRNLDFGMHDGDYTVMTGFASNDIKHEFEVSVKDGKIYVL